MIEVEKLVVALADVYNRWPSAFIAANTLGNLTVQVDGEWVAWIDVRGGSGKLSTF